VVHGVCRSGRPDQLEERLWPNIRILPFNRAAAETYGRVRAELGEAGTGYEVRADWVAMSVPIMPLVGCHCASPPRVSRPCSSLRSARLLRSGLPSK
jgi:hypothetical protein